MINFKTSLFALLGIVSCGQISGDSTVDGANSQEIAQFEEAAARRTGAAAYSVEPKYDQLAMKSSVDQKEALTLNVAIFLSYDHQDGDLANDSATKAFQELQAWFETPSDKGGLIDKVETPNSSSPNTFYIEGYGRRPVKVGGSKGDDEVYWRISLKLGKILDMAPEFGKAIASNQITMLNGHFYEQQLQMAQNADQPARGLSRFFSNSNDTGIYDRAMKEFKANFSGELNPYRMVIINGCESEQIEELVIKTIKEINATQPEDKQLAVDIVGHRGKSNYRHFGAQITSFINGLNEGYDWKTLINAFTFNEPTDPKLLAIDAKLANVIPVLRRYPPTDGNSQL